MIMAVETTIDEIDQFRGSSRPRSTSLGANRQEAAAIPVKPVSIDHPPSPPFVPFGDALMPSPSAAAAANTAGVLELRGCR